MLEAIINDSDFISKDVLIDNKNYVNLLNSCKGLSFYLYHIKNKTGTNEDYNKLACKYFNYKLQDMLENCGCNLKDPESAYNKMKQYSYLLPINEKSFLDICNNDVTSLQERIFKIFKYFDQLYFVLLLIKNDMHCSKYAGNFKVYVNNLIEYVSKNNSIATLLNALINKYNERILKNISCAEEIPLIEISVTEKPQPGHHLTEGSAKKNKISDNMELQTIQIKNSALSIGKWIGIIIMPSAMLLMTFFLYKVIYIFLI
ncbi:variable surface protein [Plasmodium gonderi]|uniref:Variable surface protein n=1 Tax=Plasmodium gonderi TaxID=77519 RepID=A0A1Y1JTN9_PLAGO|nr:variable surface protein [Plasmodium gonderi]GAW84487.1 variable surface protein [Plasmodium gonderi]